MDEMDKFLSEAFGETESSEQQTDFTKTVMRNLPTHGVSAKTRSAILIGATLLSLSVPLLNSGYGEGYLMGEEIVVEGILTVQYWVDQLIFIA